MSRNHVKIHRCYICHTTAQNLPIELDTIADKYFCQAHLERRSLITTLRLHFDYVRQHAKNRSRVVWHLSHTQADFVAKLLAEAQS